MCCPITQQKKKINIWVSVAHLHTYEEKDFIKKYIHCSDLNTEYQQQCHVCVSTISITFPSETTLLSMSTTISCMNCFQLHQLIFKIAKLNQWYLTSICFFLVWYSGFVVRCIALCELQQRVGAGRSIRPLAEISADNQCSQMASSAASDVAMYSASVVQSAVKSCNFDLHDMASPP